MPRKATIEQKLSVLNPHTLKVIDNSADHAGHAGNLDDKGNTHFSVQISAQALNGLSKIKQHRIINDLLKSEFDNGLHALSIKILAKT